MKPVSTAAFAFTVLAALGAATASLVTLAWANTFPPSGFAPMPNTVLAEARGWSVATLAFALPLTLTALVAARRGSVRGRLAWIGGLGYLSYTSLEFAVSGPFTPLYLVYIGTLAFAAVALVIGVSAINLGIEDELPAWNIPRRTIAAFSLLLSTGLAFAWLRPILRRIQMRDFGWPDSVGSVAHVVKALDLGLVVPLGIATAALLLRRRRSGDIAAALFLVFSALMGAALCSMVAASALVSGESIAAALPFFTLTLVSALVCGAYFRALGSSRRV